MRRAIATLFTAVALTATASAWAQDKIRVATEGAFAPWNFTNAQGQLDGFEIDFTHELCARIKADCTIYAQNWDGIIPSIKTGKYDVIIASMGITPKRREVIAFSDPYAATANTFLTLKDGPLSTLAGNGESLGLEADKARVDAVVKDLATQMDGKIIGVQTSTTAASFLADRLKGVEFREYKTIDEANLDLIAGRIDAVMADATVLHEALKTPDMKEAHLTGPLLSGKNLGSVAIGLRKEDTALKAQLDAGILKMRQDGSLKKLSEKWFGLDISPKA
ncbi:transporter substrate-binding domain-containing protein [Affinibrenneria salicis]|uniref:Transporter substrate-binding domain-containing protein n=1 Tax=Affinibrenneria salicis TaxID=2590031 RepID=A0A5J5G3S7_9GAMM|nr:lysine/arginine/ornithine ABC transporter substrate-binding protein [Affinibrenneria salicis]KAA9001311.1 transporter substrate-binding domain-containing protein [Affinibrenneria salicis]